MSKKQKRKKRGVKHKRIDVYKFYHSDEWARARYRALAAGRGKCCLCGRGSADGITLQVDHIFPVRSFPEKRLDQSNLQVLCSQCNRGKGNKVGDWREPSLRVLMGEEIEIIDS